MSAIRLPLLCAFAGGCLSSAVLFGLWRADAGAGAPAAMQVRQPNVERVAPVVALAVAAQRAEQPHDLLTGVAAEHVRNGAGEPAPQAIQALDSDNHELAGSAVSDVLMDLEAAYRARAAATAPTRASAAPEHAAAPSNNAVAATEPSAQSATQLVAAAVPVVAAPALVPAPASVAPPSVVAAALVAPPSVVAAAPVAPAAAPPRIAAAPAFVAQADSRPSELRVGDINQNTYNITNVRQGDVYLIQMQQLVMLQYMQLLGMSSGLAGPAQYLRGARPQGTPFTSTITNPDNPWGFHFSPPNLVH